MRRFGMVLPEREAPLVLPWALPGRAAGLIQFDRPDQWTSFVDGLGVNPRVPGIAELTRQNDNLVIVELGEFWIVWTRPIHRAPIEPEAAVEDLNDVPVFLLFVHRGVSSGR